MSKSGMNSDQLKKLIREVPDFPKKGILFYDITTLLRDKTGFAQLIDLFSEHYIGKNIDLILGMQIWIIIRTFIAFFLVAFGLAYMSGVPDMRALIGAFLVALGATFLWRLWIAIRTGQ